MCIHTMTMRPHATPVRTFGVAESRLTYQCLNVVLAHLTSVAVFRPLPFVTNTFPSSFLYCSTSLSSFSASISLVYPLYAPIYPSILTKFILLCAL